MLSVLIWLPLVGGALLFLLNRGYRIAALATTVATLGGVLVAAGQLAPDGGMQLQESCPWLPSLGLGYELGADGLALVLVALNQFLTLLAIMASTEPNRPRLYYALILILGGGVNGAFLTQNLLLFFLFYEVELIPLYLLIAIWGGAQRSYAATKFLLYTAVSGVILLVAFLSLGALAGGDGTLTFNWLTLRSHSLGLTTQIILLLLVVLGFGIKIPLVPVHTWLPDAHVEASTAISVLLAGVLLKLGTYGLLRFGLGLFPEAWQVLAPYLATLAVVSVLYGCLTAITQIDMKKMVAYSSIGHMGYILLAIAADTPLSLMGAMLQMVSHGLISALLFLLVGLVYRKTGTRMLTEVQGLLNPERGLPVTGGLMILAAMASAGIPGMVGFIAEFLIFRGSFEVFPVQTLLCMLGTALTAVYFLILLDRAFFGRLEIVSDRMITAAVQWQEKLPALSLALLVLAFGLQPHWLSRWLEGSVRLMHSGSWGS